MAIVLYLASVYIKAGIDELLAYRLPEFMANKYGTIEEATKALSGIEQARETFFNFKRKILF